MWEENFGTLIEEDKKEENIMLKMEKSIKGRKKSCKYLLPCGYCEKMNKVCDKT